MFNFDEPVERRGTHSLKWDSRTALPGLDAPDAIPMWVADMDFAAPPAVAEALRATVEQAAHGYYFEGGTWRAALGDWLESRHGWRPDPDWVIPTPGIVSALGLIQQGLSDPGDGVVVFPPAYHAFEKIIRANKRDLIHAPLVEEQGRYRMDLETLERTLPRHARLVFFCSPHNPGGTVWSPEEIRALADLCVRRDLILVSDEIHCDLIYSHAKHTPTIVAAPEIADRLVVTVSATKTFNLAGAHVGAVVAPNPGLRRGIEAAAAASALLMHPSFGMIATEAAWRGGASWLDALLPYLEDVRDRFDAGIAEAVPGARSMRLDATYLSWVDFSETGLSPEEVQRRICETARIGPSPGPQFGPGGAGRMRFNIATRKAIVEEAVSRLADAFADLR